MTLTLRLTSSSLALALFAAPAFALTPDEVWTGWTGEYAALGYTVDEGTREEANGKLTFTDVTITGGDTTSRVEFLFPQIIMEQDGGDNVRSTFPADIKVNFSGTDDDDDSVTISSTVKMPDAEILSSGDTDNRTDTVTAPQVTVTIDQVDGPEDGPLTDLARIEVNDLNSQIKTSDGGKAMTSSSRIARIDYTISASQPDGGIEGTGSFEDIESSGDYLAPSDGVSLQEDMAKALRAGAGISGAFKAGANEHKGNFTATDEDDQPVEGSYAISGEGMAVTIGMAQEGLSYQGSFEGLKTAINGSQMPFPVSYGIASMLFDVQSPVARSNEPEPFKLNFALDELTLGDEIWESFDPDGKLSRTPANLNVDLGGKVKLARDLFDPELGESDDDMPVRPTEVDIRQILLDGLGAKVLAKGALKEAGDGDITTPVGEIKTEIEGANTLMDTLVAMGLLPQDQMQGVRMMLAMFSRPGDKPDSLVSDIEFKEGGQIFANGQQIR